MTADLRDVVVAGAGPAGSTTAALLARRGYRVVLLDRSHFPRPKACAEYLSPGVTDVLRRVGLEDVLEGARAVPGMEVISPRGAVLRLRYEAGGAPLSASTLPRQVFDTLLVERAASYGVEVVEGFVARSVLVEDGVVRGVIGGARGQEQVVRGRLTVVADGARSALARSLGLTRSPRWPVRLGLVAHYEGTPDLRSGFGQMHVGPHGYCGVAPLPEDRVNVAMVLPAGAVRAAGVPAGAYFERWIGAQPRLAGLLERCRRITPIRGMGPIGSRSRRAWAPGALLVGDAAGFFDPFTGEGIYRALVGAEMAAQVAQAALAAADVSGRSLQPYDAMRAAAFRSKGAVTALVQLFVQYPSLMEYALPRLALRDDPAGTLAAVLGDVAEPRSFLNPRMLWSALHP